MTEVRQQTLTEFLLARIAEDEMAAVLIGESDMAPTWKMTTWPHDGEGVPFEAAERTFHPHRVLAECEAKRRIIETCMGDDPDQGELDPHFADERVPALVLRALALPYAGHPGYREEWRP